MIDWASLPQWVLTRSGPLYVLKIAETIIKTGVCDTIVDSNLQIDQHCTETGRLIGYSLKIKRKPRREGIVFPKTYLKDRVLFVSYNPSTKRRRRRNLMRVVLCDNNVRIIRFGKKDDNAMYVFAVRSRDGADEYAYDEEN